MPEINEEPQAIPADMTTESYTTYYECKFARERKSNPTRWMILPKGTLSRPRYDLVRIGGDESEEAT